MSDDTLPTDGLSPSAPRVRPLALAVAHHIDPDRVGERVRLPEVTVQVGRGAADLGPGFLDDPRLSRRHARFAVRSGRLHVEDLDSRNGTWVNGRRVDRADLAVGDVVNVGEMLLVVTEAPAGRPVPGDPELLGISTALAEVLAGVRAVAPRATTVLVLGEPGVGKEGIARVLHRESGRRGSLVAVNCAGLADGVLHSELFGHKRGAFSGAVRDRPGLVERARGGTLFLDEIGDASPNMQATLLRLLEEREVRAVGADAPAAADVRIVAATNRDLAAEAIAGRFRYDLLTRLERWVIEVPPLRERREDIGLLAAHFAAHHAGRPIRLSRRFVARLLAFHWPGNVRQLDAVVERAVVDAGTAEVVDSPPWLDRTFDRHTAPEPTGAPVAVRPSRLPRPDREGLVALLQAHDGNVTALAEAAGVTRQTVYRWARALGVDLERQRS